MSTHSIAEAQTDLPNLIRRARSGEDVVIMEDGLAIAQIRAIEPTPKRATAAGLDMLAAHRARMTRAKTDAGTFVSQMRDEEER